MIPGSPPGGSHAFCRPGIHRKGPEESKESRVLNFHWVVWGWRACTLESNYGNSKSYVGAVS